jgi:DNA polymerase-3 subunit beta
MKFSCDSDKLQKSISIVEKSVSPRTSLPVLENIYLELTGNQLTLRGNDLEIGIEHQIEVENVQAEGKVLLKAKTISSVLSKLPHQKLDIEVDSQNNIHINANNSLDFDLLGVATEEYPVFPSLEDGVRFSLPVSELKDLIKHTIFAVSFDETKQFLNGILVTVEKDNLVFVSTDGYRLSLKKSKVEGLSDNFSVIVPFKAMNEINKIIQNLDSKTIDINISPSQVGFVMEGFLFISRVIQGQFPDYKQVIPAESLQSFNVSRKQFLDACERASIIASASNNVVRLSFDNDHITMRANAPSMGEFKESVSSSRAKGDGDAKIAFNVRLVLDSIKTLDVDNLRVEFNNELSPCMIIPANDDDYTYIIMPIRTSDYRDAAQSQEKPAVSAVG